MVCLDKKMLETTDIKQLMISTRAFSNWGSTKHSNDELRMELKLRTFDSGT